MAIPIKVEEPRPIEDYSRVLEALKAAHRRLSRMIMSGDKLTPSRWYDALDDLYESLQRADEAYAKEAWRYIPPSTKKHWN